LIHHSDRGLQYCNPLYTNVLKENRIKISMTTKYDSYENAIAERVNGILKDEFYISDSRMSKLEARHIIDRSIKVYIEIRPHMSCDDNKSSTHKRKVQIQKMGKVFNERRMELTILITN